MRTLFWILMLALSFMESNTVAYSFNRLQVPIKSATSSKQLENDESIRIVTCEWVSAGREIDPIKLAEDNAVKLALFSSALSGKGIMKAKKICFTFEGDPIPIDMTIKRGKIKVTEDLSQDRGGVRRFKFLPRFFTTRSYCTRKIQIGYFNDRGKFVALDGEVSKGTRLFLKLKDKEYF